MDDQTIADWLGKARRYLEEHGWTQYQFGPNREGKVCAVGALMACNELQLLPHPRHPDEETGVPNEVVELARYLTDVGNLPRGPVGRGYTKPADVLAVWNDECGRTAQEVIDLFAKGEKVAIAGFDPDAP